METFSTPGLAIKGAVGNAVYYSDAFAKAVRDAFVEFSDPEDFGAFMETWQSIAAQFGYEFRVHASTVMRRVYSCKEL